MIKKFLVFSFLISVLFGYDATVEIVKKMDSLPKIAIQDASSDSDLYLRKKFFKLLRGDFRVSSHFRVLDEYLTSSYDGSIGENFLSDKNVDLSLRYKIVKNPDGIQVEIKLINARGGEVKTERSYRMTNIRRYPFLAHRIVIDINDEIGAPSVNWM